jgi:hypothetical protein
LPAICIQHPTASTLLIDALNPGSRESEMQAVAVVSCFASAILFDVSALSHTQFLLVCCIVIWPIECESGDGIDEVLEVAMKGDQSDGISSLSPDFVRLLCDDVSQSSPTETQTD